MMEKDNNNNVNSVIDQQPIVNITTSTSTTITNTDKNNNNNNDKKKNKQSVNNNSNINNPNNPNNKNKNDSNQLVVKANNDVYKRINFLYQASTLLQTHTDNQAVSSFYNDSLKKVAQKQVIRINPSIKRTICKKCSTLLIPGQTSTVRMQESRESHVVLTCDNCKKVKRFDNSHNKKNKKDRKRENRAKIKKRQQELKQQQQQKEATPA